MGVFYAYNLRGLLCTVKCFSRGPAPHQFGVLVRDRGEWVDRSALRALDGVEYFVGFALTGELDLAVCRLEVGPAVTAGAEGGEAEEDHAASLARFQSA